MEKVLPPLSASTQAVDQASMANAELPLPQQSRQVVGTIPPNTNGVCAGLPGPVNDTAMSNCSALNGLDLFDAQTDGSPLTGPSSITEGPGYPSWPAVQCSAPLGEAVPNTKG